MMNDQMKKWLEYDKLDQELKEELLKLSPKELEDAFHGELTFGTGGLRGIIGAGTNRLNIYVIQKTTYGYLKYLQKYYPDYQKRGVVIGFDTRRNSEKFAKAAASVLGAAGVKVYLADQVTPTPLISFTIRDFNSVGGIMLTASHNPPQYNGFKVFDHTGCQLLPDDSDFISHQASLVEDIFAIATVSVEELLSKGIVEYFNNDEAFLQMVRTVRVNQVNAQNIKIVYTPLHGTGGRKLPELLRSEGFDVYTVSEQMVPDGNFSTLKYPNPEDPNAFQMAEKLARIYRADLILATDPDADRMGAAVRVDEDYYYFNGNELGALMLYYLAQFKKPKRKGVVISTIVTSSVGQAICEKYGLEYQETLTGFKNIGALMNKIDESTHEYFFGYEESFGSIIKDFIRDKDGFQASLMFSEMTSFYKEQGKTLVDVLHQLDEEVGYYRDSHININLEGGTGLQMVDQIMGYFRENNPFEKELTWIEDYLVGIRTTKDGQSQLTIPTSNVLKFGSENKWWVALRPSGTEPKLKLYLMAVDSSEQRATSTLKYLRETITKAIEQLRDNH